METKIHQTGMSFMRQHRVNLILGALILVLAMLVIVNVSSNKHFGQASLLNASNSVMDLTLQSNTVTDTTVPLTLVDPNPNGQFFTGEVRYDVKYYTGEVSTDQLMNKIGEFTDIEYTKHSNENGVLSITAAGLSPSTIYTFAALKKDSSQIVHISNALGVKTVSTQVVAVTSSASFLKGDVNNDSAVTERDAYALTMYLYYKNWVSFLVAMSDQGVTFDAKLLESQFKERADVNGDCVVDFSDVFMIAQMANNKIPTSTMSVKTQCTY